MGFKSPQKWSIRVILSRFRRIRFLNGWSSVNSQTKAHILIVDDNPYNLEVLSRRLDRRGYHTTCVDNGRAALEHIKSEEVDIVLLDIMMPEMDGMEVLDRTRDYFSKTELPVIMVTSKDESRDVVEALNHGANDYIVKPIDFPVALARIEKELSQSREAGDMSRSANKFSLKDGEKFGTYLVKGKVGQGGMGAVYKIYDSSLNRIVALKVILPGQELSKSQVERFKREARAIAQIKHRNIVSVYHIEEHPRHYFTMDYIEGDNLSKTLKKGAMDIKEAIAICSKIASALNTAHSKGILHRDLKSSNIMIDTNGEPHLMDFGLAKLESEDEQITRTGDMLGTPEFMSPEQVDPSCGEVGPRTDIYSLGVILYEMLTGQPPFSGTAIRILWQKLNQMPKNPSEINPSVPPELERICMRALSREQDLRFQSANEMYNALASLV